VHDDVVRRAVEQAEVGVVVVDARAAQVGDGARAIGPHRRAFAIGEAVADEEDRLCLRGTGREDGDEAGEGEDETACGSVRGSVLWDWKPILSGVCRHEQARKHGGGTGR
jgi:hypothetical protein